MVKSNCLANRLTKVLPLSVCLLLLFCCACTALSAQPEIVIEGDSLSVFYPGSFASALKTAIGDRAEVTSLARTGDTVYELLFQPVPMPRSKAIGRPSIALLWAGTNDINQGVPAETVFLNLLSETKRFQEKGWRVVILTSIQRQSRHNDAVKDAERLKFNNLIRHYPPEKAPWASVIDVAALPAFSDVDSTVTANTHFYYPDGVHLSAEGGKVIADKVLEYLRF